jgi:thymidine kinase
MYQENTKSGFLEIILGPMFSGKTTALIDLYHDYNKNLNIPESKIMVLNYTLDKRYHDNMLSTHDLKMIPCHFIENLADVFLFPEYDETEVILINEGQFFDDLYQVVNDMVTRDKKNVHICGLDGDFKRKRFGQLLDLIPLCDNVTKFKSKCNDCGKPALFSHRITEERSQVSIGSSNYVPLCRFCYEKTNL